MSGLWSANLSLFILDHWARGRPQWVHVVYDLSSVILDFDVVKAVLILSWLSFCPEEVRQSLLHDTAAELTLSPAGSVLWQSLLHDTAAELTLSPAGGNTFCKMTKALCFSTTQEADDLHPRSRLPRCEDLDVEPFEITKWLDSCIMTGLCNRERVDPVCTISF